MAGSWQDRGRNAAIATGSRLAEQGILKYHYNFSLYLGCLWSDFQQKLWDYTPEYSPDVG